MTPRIHRRAALWIALVLLQLFWAVTRNFDTYDEMWFLQVVKRMVDGETLYRDIYFNTTPLSAVLTAGVVAFTGAQLIVEKLLIAFCILGSLAIALKIIDRAVPSQEGTPMLLVALVLVYGNYPSMTPYSPLAVMFYMLMLYGFIVWLETRATPALFWSAIAAGLCFATKYNAGVLAAGALALATIVSSLARREPRRAIVRNLAIVGGGFGICVVIVLAIIGATGGLESFVEYAFRNKTTYIEIGSASYADGIRLLIAAAREPLSMNSLMKIYRLLILVVPLATVVLWIRYAIRSPRDEKIRAIALAIFLAAGYAITYPRAAGATTYVIPILGAIGVVAWRLGGAPRHPVARRCCVILMSGWLGFALTMMLVNPLRRLASDEWRFSRIPHCRWILVAAATDEELLGISAELRNAVPGEGTFIQTMTAGFYYLSTGIENPAPYDMPARTTFGPEGQRNVIALIEAGRIAHVVAMEESRGSQTPVELLRYLDAAMIPTAKSERFTVYSRPASAG